VWSFVLVGKSYVGNEVDHFDEQVGSIPNHKKYDVLM
jgi:hypothetical protein